MHGSHGFVVKLLLLGHPLVCLFHFSDGQASFANVTLYSPNGDLSAVIFLPKGLKPDEPTYYMASRFDHSSMIGNIRRTSRNVHMGKKTTHLLYGTEQWRVPHDPYWPESGVGLAAEFGVGDDGAFCSYRCGWYQVNEVTNGVLGYDEAKIGESFLKIGVGELIKGSCPLCDSSEDYKFNSPYEFKKRPDWHLETTEDIASFMALSHEAVLNQHGYKLRKEITLQDDVILVKTTLTNIGRIPFATAWYSHHFYTCDNHPINTGVGVDLDLAATGGNYDEPGTWFWSTPIENYASITPMDDTVSVEMRRGVEQNVRIKAEFSKDDESRGEFAIHGCETLIKETIPEMKAAGGTVSMYAFNLYIETGTFSPEPQLYMHLWPGQTTTWTQRLDFEDFVESPSTTVAEVLEFATVEIGPTHAMLLRSFFDRTFVAFALAVASLAIFIQGVWKWRRNGAQYTPIADHPAGGPNQAHQRVNFV
jgi:hypothetical protein